MGRTAATPAHLSVQMDGRSLRRGASSGWGTTRQVGMPLRTSAKTKEDIWHQSQARRIKSTCSTKLAKVQCGSERLTEREKDPGSGLTAVPSTSRAGPPESQARREQRTVLSSTGLNNTTKDGMTLAVIHHLALFAQGKFAQVQL